MMRRNVKILVAEDDADERVFLQRAFKKAGLGDEIFYAPDGEQAIEFLQQVDTETAPKLLIVDLKMPRIDGFQLMEWVGQRRPLDGMRVVVLTNSDVPGDMSRAIDLGANEYHVKPHDLDGLTRLAEGLKFYLKTQEALARMTAGAQKD